MAQPNDQYPDFTNELHAAYLRAKQEAKYHAPYFLQMLHESHGYDTALKLILTKAPTTGFTHLWERKRLDLTAEAIVLQPQWFGLFPQEVLVAAYTRLKQLDYGFPTDSWTPERQAASPVIAAPVQVPAPINPPPPPPPAETPPASDLAAPPPERVETTTYRILRDTELARRVKMMHGYKCQICGETITLADGTFYAEAHHIKPLGSPHNGPDELGNLLCLCPNHHVMMDYAAAPLDAAKLRPATGHTVSPEFIDHHNRLVIRQPN